MPKNCKCQKCCPPKCVDPCLLLVEPCNPCNPCNPCQPYPCPPYPCPPYNPCDPCPPCPQPFNPCNPCPPYPYPCPPANTDVNPKYVVSNAIITTTDDVPLSINIVNCNNFIVFNPTAPMNITMPEISKLNNNGKKSVNLVNLSAFTLTVSANSNDSMNGASPSVSIGVHETLSLHSLKGISVNGKTSTWAVNH